MTGTHDLLIAAEVAIMVHDNVLGFFLSRLAFFTTLTHGAFVGSTHYGRQQGPPR